MGLLIARNIILVTVLIANTRLSSSTALSNIDCSNVESDFEKCLYLSAAQEEDTTSLLFQLCQNTECFLQCIIDAIGECDTTDKYFQYDVDVLIVYYRSICNQINSSANALALCDLDNTTCLNVSGAMEFFQNASVFYDSGRYLEFRHAQCEYLNRSTDCLQPHGSGECTTELADIAYEIKRALAASFKGCGQPQDHPFFTTYGGPPKCLTPYTSSETPPSTNSVPSSSTNIQLTDSTSPYRLTTPFPTLSAINQINQSDSTLSLSPVTTNIPPSSSTASSNINCSSVHSDLFICNQIYRPVQNSNLTSIMLQTCQNIECYLQCMSDAIGDCDNTDKYIKYDLNVLIVSNRAACNHLDLYLNGLSSCELYNMSCFKSNGATVVLEHADSYYSSGDYTHFKEATCNFTRLITDCIQLDITENCTVETSNFYEEYLRVSSSLAHCGYPQDHVFFQTYGGSLNCILPNIIGPSGTSALPSSSITDQSAQYTMYTSTKLSTSMSSSFSVKDTSPTASVIVSVSPSSTQQTITTFYPTTATLLSSIPQTTTTSLSTTTTLLSSMPQTTTTSLSTTATLLSSTPQTLTTSLPTTATLLSSTPQTTVFASISTTVSLLSSTPQTETTSLPTTATLFSLTPQTTTTSIPPIVTLLSSAPQTKTTSLPTTATLLSSTPQKTTSQTATVTLLSSTPQTETTFPPTTATLLSSTPQTTTLSPPTTSTLLSSTPQKTTTSVPTTAMLLSSTPQTETTSPPTSATLLSSTPQTRTTPVPTTKKTSASPLGYSESVIAAGLAKCFTISLDQISSTHDILTSYCSDLECNIQCFINAVGKCYTEDQFFVYDTEVYKVTSRVYCNDIYKTLFSLLNCQMTNLSCLTALTNSIQTEVLQAFKAHDYSTYRHTYCTALTSFQSCAAFAASESCTSTLAQHALDLYVASTSYGKCGLQNHEYFTTYGEDATCSAVTTTRGNVILIAVLTVLLFV